MVIKALVIRDAKDSFDGKRGRVRFRYLDCCDASRPLEDRLLNTFTFILSDLDEETFPQDLGDRLIEIGIKQINHGFGGRPEMRGRIVKVLS